MVLRLTFHTAEKTHPKPSEFRRDLWTSVRFAAGPWRRTGDGPCSYPTSTCVVEGTCCVLCSLDGGKPSNSPPCAVFPTTHSLLDIQKNCRICHPQAEAWGAAPHTPHRHPPPWKLPLSSYPGWNKWLPSPSGSWQPDVTGLGSQELMGSHCHSSKSQPPPDPASALAEDTRRNALGTTIPCQLAQRRCCPLKPSRSPPKLPPATLAYLNWGRAARRARAPDASSTLAPVGRWAGTPSSCSSWARRRGGRS